MRCAAPPGVPAQGRIQFPVLITINGQTREIAPGTTVAELLGELNLLGRPCAVEVNKQLVAKSQHTTRQLADGDTVEVVTLVGGG